MQLLEPLVTLDASLFYLLNVTLSHPLLDPVFTSCTEALFWVVPGTAAALLFIVKKRREALLVLGLGILTVAITDPLSARVLKPLFGRLRPCHPRYFVEGGRFLAGMKHSFSFPSVHAANIFAQAALLFFFYPRWKWTYLSFACFIGYTRIYVGVHYPFDVVGGALLGIGIGCAVFFCYRLAAVRFRWMNIRDEGKGGVGPAIAPEAAKGLDGENSTLQQKGG